MAGGLMKGHLRGAACTLGLLVGIVAITSQTAQAIPAFARKYGLPCSACHEAWPKLNSFGQNFKDNGYQLNNDRDSPIWMNPSYWPVAMRITPHWHYESAGHQTVQSGDGTVERTINTSGFASENESRTSTATISSADHKRD